MSNLTFVIRVSFVIHHSCFVIHGSALAGSKPADGLLDQPSVVGRVELGADNLAGQIDGHRGALIGQALDGGVGGGLDLLERSLLLGLGLGLRAVDQFLAEPFGMFAALFEDSANFVLRFRQFLLVAGQNVLGLLIGSLGLGDLVGDVIFAFVQARGQRPPGLSPKNRQQAQENDGGP
jgi:hypothetical protein